jgi:hypothetical protein
VVMRTAGLEPARLRFRRSESTGLRSPSLMISDCRFRLAAFTPLSTVCKVRSETSLETGEAVCSRLPAGDKCLVQSIELSVGTLIINTCRAARALVLESRKLANWPVDKLEAGGRALSAK